MQMSLKKLATLLLSSTTATSLINAQATQPTSYDNTTDAPTVDLGYVRYVGYTNERAGIDYFRGIRYAQAPTGQLRWRKPLPIESHNDYDGRSINATQIGPACYQSQPQATFTWPDSFSSRAPWGESEDCLLLDVLVPVKPVSSALPVMVHIHGGGEFDTDECYSSQREAQLYPGDAMVNASSGNIIFVSVQYRLGIFGFLAGSQVQLDGVLNAGLLDQRAALDWIQRNIRAFGGDPTRVTIWGASAGGSSVTYQLTARGAYDEPPFSAAIAEYPWWQPVLNESTQEAQLFQALRLSDCSTVQSLRELSSEHLALLGQQVQNATYPGPGFGYGHYTFGPVVDGGFVQTLPDVAFKTGRFYDVPLMVDREGYEGWLFSNASVTTMSEEEADARYLFPYGGPAFFSRLYQLYPRSDYNSTFFQRQSWFGDFIVSCPTYQIARSAVDTNSNSSAVFKMTFDAGSQIHGSTAAFLASNITGFPGANNQTLAAIMSSYFISFCASRDPNPLRADSAPFWPSYTSGGNGTAAMGTSVGFTVNAVTYGSILPAADPDASEKCEFFGNNGYVVRN